MASYELAYTGVQVDEALAKVSAVASELVGLSDTQSLTNKTINPAQNIIDGDVLDITWNPSYYTPSSAPSQASDINDLTAHLYGIDQVLAGIIRETQQIMFVLRDTAHSRWTIVPGYTDRVLGIKGGSNAFNVSSGVFMGGTWGLSGLSSSVAGGHTHSASSSIALASDGDDYFLMRQQNEGKYKDGDLSHNHTITVNAVGGHSHTISQNGTWRPAAALGLFQRPNF